MTTQTPTTTVGKAAGRGSAIGTVGLLSLVFIGGTAGAYWTSGGLGFGFATAGTLGAPLNVTAGPLNGTSDTLVIDWDAPTTGAPVTGYRVNKDTAAGALLCSSPAPSTTCNATGLLPSSTYNVVVTSLLNNSWTASSAAVGASTNAPAATLNITNPAANATNISTTPTITGTSTTAGTIALAVRAGTATTGTTVASGTATTDGTSPWSGTVSPALANNTQYTVTATQTTPGGTSTVSKTFTTVAATAPVSVTTTTLPNATQNSPYSTQLAATGGTPPYTWAVTAGSLPTGLTLSTDGVLSGTPTGTGASTFSVVATDSANSPSPAQSLTLTVNAPADTTAPVVTSVTSSLEDGSYTVGQNVPVSINFSEAVTVVGTPQLVMETGTVDRTANYVSGSGTTALTFSYTVQVGDTSSDLNYVGTTSLGLPGSASIKDAAGNNANLALPATNAPGSLAGSKAIVIDTTAPVANSFTAARMGTTLGQVSSGDVMNFGYSESINPASLITGWNGTGTQSITVTAFNGTAGGNDELRFGTLNIGTLNLGSTAFFPSSSTVSATVTLNAAKTIVTVTLGATPTGSANGGNPQGKQAMTWNPSASARDTAGNACATTPFVITNDTYF